jgi:hypothetical protein
MPETVAPERTIYKPSANAASFQLPAQLGDYLRRRFFEQSSGQAADSEAGGPQRELAGAVILEGDLAAVSAVSVGFDHQPGSAPEEVDGEVADPDVDLRRRYAMAPAEVEEVELEVAASATGSPPGARVEPVAAQLGFAGGAAEEVGVEVGRGEVGDGAGDRGHGDAVAAGAIARWEQAGTVEGDAVAACPAGPAG